MPVLTVIVPVVSNVPPFSWAITTTVLPVLPVPPSAPLLHLLLPLLPLLPLPLPSLPRPSPGR